MSRRLHALSILALLAPPAFAQIGENPVLEAGGTTCGEYLQMNSLSRREALIAVQPLGGEAAGAGASPDNDWADDVARACEGQPDRYLDDAAAQALRLP